MLIERGAIIRFLQQDSVLGSPTDPRTLHRYAYAFNNPVNYTDPAVSMPGGTLGYLRRNEPPAQRPHRSYKQPPLGHSGGLQQPGHGQPQRLQ